MPTADALSRQRRGASLKPLISESLQNVAKAAGLQSYEVPRDFIIETTPFTLENGLLTGIRKLARPKLKEHYGDRLEQLYAELADSQANELRALRHSGADRPVLETISRAAGALLGASTTDLAPEAHFNDLGGDSLSALTFANLLHEIFDVDVPVGVIVSPATDLQVLADYIEAERTSGTKRPTFAAVHGRDATEVHARDLTLDKFLDAQTLAAAPALPRPSAEVRTVLLTGATGFLGRYLALEWLERMDLVGGKLICLVRAKDDAAARERLDKTFDSGDPELLRHYRELAAQHLEVIAGDKSEPNLGLDHQTWQRLADTVDLIVDPAALVNHVLPYSQLFGPNALGTAELIRIALTTKLKPFTYVSTLGVGDQIEPSAFTEDADIRVISPTRVIGDSYANGYANSKWAGEVLLREAHDLCGLPVAVFRCDMIMVDTKYVGQLNVPDIFTRLMLSLVATGIAPGSFYETDQGWQSAAGALRRAARRLHRRGDLHPRRTRGGRVRDLPRGQPVRRRHWARRIRRLADRGRLPDPTDHRLRRLAAAVRDRHACPARTAEPALATAAVARLPTTRKADPRVHLAGRPFPFRGAGRENRPGQRHPPRLGADHRQIHHQPATARAAMRPTPSPATKTFRCATSTSLTPTTV